jgi:SAM-dependent methyltransferase
VTKLTLAEWHSRFNHQAQWTKEVRENLFRYYGVNQKSKILEVGCGTGAVIAELMKDFPACYFGVDNQFGRLAYAHALNPDPAYSNANGEFLPFKSNIFDGVFCHFLFLWIKNPARVIKEMVKITRPGGFVAAFAEPDYGGRIDYPVSLSEPGRLQSESLKHQGADPEIGRKLAGLFSSAGLINIQVGILGSWWQFPQSNEEFESEWEILKSDLCETLPLRKLAEFKKIDYLSRIRGERILYVPTFFAAGEVPNG